MVKLAQHLKETKERGLPHVFTQAALKEEDVGSGTEVIKVYIRNDKQ